jgi:hypothetical protein
LIGYPAIPALAPARPMAVPTTETTLVVIATVL